MALGRSAFAGIQGTAASFLVRSTIVLTLSLVGLLVSGCDEDDQRAVSPGSVRDFATAVADESPDANDGEPEAFTSPLENGVLGAPLPRASRVYFVSGSDIWQVPVGDDPLPVVESEAVVGFSASASGHRLAVLSLVRDEGSDGEQTSLSLVLPDGSTIFDLTQFTESPALDMLSPIESIALTPAGNGLAMTHQNGALTSISLDGEIRQLIEPDPERSPGRLSWSSDGRYLAYLDPWVPNEPSSLYVLVPETGVRQVLVSASESGHGVEQASWIPGTSNLVYTRSSSSTIAYGGDMFIVDALTGDQQLLLSSGEIAPVSGAVDLAVSPDGDTIAFTAFVPGDEFPEFAGLWTVDVSTGDLTRIQVDGGHSVTDVWWLEDKLLYRVIDEPRTRFPGAYTGREEFRLVEYNPVTSRSVERGLNEPADEPGDESQDDSEDADDERENEDDEDEEEAEDSDEE